MNLAAINDENFREELLESDRPVLIDFYATWCGPCKQLTPLINELEREYGDALAVRKIDVDEEPELASQFQIRSIPTLMIYRSGHHVETLVGAQSRSVLKQVVDRAVDVDVDLDVDVDVDVDRDAEKQEAAND